MNDKDKIIDLIYNDNFELAKQLSQGQNIKINTTEIDRQLSLQLSQYYTQSELINELCVDVSKKLDKIQDYRNYIVRSWILDNIKDLSNYNTFKFIEFKDLESTWEDEVTQYKRLLELIHSNHLNYDDLNPLRGHLQFNKSIIEQINKLIN